MAFQCSAGVGGAQPDYLVVTHMEPDHSGSLMRIAQEYPEMKIVGNAKTFTLIKAVLWHGALSEDRMLEVGEGSTISLAHTGCASCWHRWYTGRR